MRTDRFFHVLGVLLPGKTGRRMLLTLFLLFFLNFPCFSDDGLRDIRGPVGLSPDGGWILALILIIVLLFLFILFRKFFCNKRSPLSLSEPLRPEWMDAYEAFDRLERSSLITEGRFKEYYALLSGVVRSYIERRFSIRAPEMTTEEFMEKAQVSPDLSPRQRSFLRDFLDACDRVKFAKFVPSLDEAGDSLRCARRFVDETKREEGGDGI